MKADYKCMDIEKAIETWNVQRGNDGHDKYDDLYILDNNRENINFLCVDAYNALEMAHDGDYDFSDSYVFVEFCGLFSFSDVDDDYAPWNMEEDD